MFEQCYIKHAGTWNFLQCIIVIRCNVHNRGDNDFYDNSGNAANLLVIQSKKKMMHSYIKKKVAARCKKDICL